MKKKFFIVEVAIDGSANSSADATILTIVEEFDGTVSEARDLILSDAFSDGNYRVLEDTSGIIVRQTVSAPKTKLQFEPSRKKPRKATAGK